MDLTQRSAGVLLHITSLPGPHGIGDFGPDAFRFVDWLQSAGQRIWQWLPSTPIGPGDSPYQGVSAFAGSQWMVALEPLVERGWLEAPALPDGGFDAACVDYGRVLPWRETQLRAAAAGFVAKATLADKAAHKAWCEAQAGWLDDYALFMAIRSPRGGQPWWEWPAPLARREKAALAAARNEHATEVAFWKFVQWCFDTQCAALKCYANERGVSLMGDLPIFVAHDSADCWSRPDLYLLDDKFQTTVVAGVPPDDLGPLGQRWGNPLYRWDKMADENYAWWTARVKRALTSADVFRIDHFRGFAGYFEIPAESPDARQGRWLTGPGKPLFDAIEQALGKLPIVAEDLGYITPDVHALRDGCGFPGMKILQFAFGGDGTHEFLPHMWTPNSVAYTGTHDNDTVRGWWDHASPRERAFAGSYLACSEHDVHWAMIRACCNSVANIAVFPLQDVLGLPSSHRMNIPGVLGGNWGWRFSWPMIGAETTRVLGLITAASGRGPFELLHLPC
ncbi:MAG TPA: 4-alpha-glucanotransferase [Ideonella sp.]|uniref:4-alpha-glucanotransferase n=1 Tax=Ideonella sp. TaxID=1929293 RepID=UPI002E32AFAC|nr:4-alpha-glucanotransferase [Ideonella sp.]HEX5683804.1 4-alpha-glucanotransferase [Ideonella sp.]